MDGMARWPHQFSHLNSTCIAMAPMVAACKLPAATWGVRSFFSASHVSGVLPRRVPVAGLVMPADGSRRCRGVFWCCWWWDRPRVMYQYLYQMQCHLPHDWIQQLMMAARRCPPLMLPAALYHLRCQKQAGSCGCALVATDMLLLLRLLLLLRG
jgi:hypothetical protein